jgi:hypothetical protein
MTAATFHRVAPEHRIFELLLYIVPPERFFIQRRLNHLYHAGYSVPIASTGLQQLFRLPDGQDNAVRRGVPLFQHRPLPGEHLLKPPWSGVLAGWISSREWPDFKKFPGYPPAVRSNVCVTGAGIPGAVTVTVSRQGPAIENRTVPE